MHAKISDEPLNVAKVVSLVSDDRSGAVVTFTGVVRNHDGGQSITAIDYSAHPHATQILADLVEQCATRDGVHGVAAEHRIGHVEVGGTAMVVAVSADHRGQAFEAACEFVDAVKESLPVWKCQWLTDGSHEWAGLTGEEP